VTSSSASAPASTHADAIITVRDFQYEVPSSVKPGSLVTVTNMDSTPHTLTDRNAGGFDVEIPGGETAILQAPDSHGEYGFTCIFHPKMKGTLVVK
jgi:plastocyanin